MLQEIAAFLQAHPQRGRLDSLQSIARSGDNQSKHQALAPIGPDCDYLFSFSQLG